MTTRRGILGLIGSTIAAAVAKPTVAAKPISGDLFGVKLLSIEAQPYNSGFGGRLKCSVLLPSGRVSDFYSTYTGDGKKDAEALVVILERNLKVAGGWLKRIK